jgi:hypothetical protein
MGVSHENGIASMPRHLAIFCICSLVLSTIADVNAASTLKITCSGNLTNTREDGVTLGQCDLNFISVKRMDEIESICGIPGTIDSPTENRCRIRAVVSPDTIFAADHRKLYKVIDVWSVDQR